MEEGFLKLNQSEKKSFHEGLSKEKDIKRPKMGQKR